MNPAFSNEERDILLRAAYLLQRATGMDAERVGLEAANRRSWEVPQTSQAVGVLHSAALDKNWSPT